MFLSLKLIKQEVQSLIVTDLGARCPSCSSSKHYSTYMRKDSEIIGNSGRRLIFCIIYHPHFFLWVFKKNVKN